MFKKIISIVSGFFFILIFWNMYPNFSTKIGKNEKETIFKNGDIIFQTSESAQCEAVKIATNSKFSHCGIIFIENEQCFVYEAVQPVKITPLKTWITHGKDNNYVVKRYKNKDFTFSEIEINKMKNYAKKHVNKNYDLYFNWSDTEIYCSELVWKIYKTAINIELCKTKKLEEFNLNNLIVKNILIQRYGKNIPLKEYVVAPSQLYDSELLITIFDNY